MPGLRLLLRMAPFVVGAVAVGVWLRRRGAERKALRAAAGVQELGAGAAPEVRELDAGHDAERFQREPIDIVTVVDDLLQAGR
jgi:hypothetical protein